jgi:HK97 gp10 family phage protein
MADAVQFKIDGLDPLLAKLDSVTKDMKFKGGRFALRKAANLVAVSAKAGALTINDPITSEEIAKNITVRWGSRKFKSTGDLSFRVGVLGGARQPDTAKKQRRRDRAGTQSLSELGELSGKGKGNPGGDTYYWRFLEFGTSHARAQPFMRRALEQNIGAATDEFIKQYNKGLDRAIKRAAKVKT